MGDTSIEWTEKTWNPVRGCSPISPGCKHCYAERMAGRFCKEGEPFHGFVQIGKNGNPGPRWTGKVELIPHMLDVPLRTRKPTTWFVNSMSDLFHEGLSDEDIDSVFAVMALCPQHTFQVLTKRADRMREYMCNSPGFTRSIRWAEAAMSIGPRRVLWRCQPAERGFFFGLTPQQGDDIRDWPGTWGTLPNVWLGVSVEDQQRADERIPLLLQTPAAVRFLSVEPLLGPVDLYQYLGGARNPIGPTYGGKGVDWVIVGGESGPGARPVEAAWVRALRDQCVGAGVPFFFKQWGGYLPGMQDGARIDGHQMLNASNQPQRVGKKAAGALLDGRLWREMPVCLETACG